MKSTLTTSSGLYTHLPELSPPLTSRHPTLLDIDGIPSHGFVAGTLL
jgi:hypothetical protein